MFSLRGYDFAAAEKKFCLGSLVLLNSQVYARRNGRWGLKHAQTLEVPAAPFTIPPAPPTDAKTD